MGVLRCLSAGLLCALLTARPAAAQEGSAADTSAMRSPVMLEGSHWAVGAARRAEAMGLAPGFLPARTEIARDLVWAALQSARGRAAARGGAIAELASGWVDRFAEEFPEYRAEAAEGAGAPALLGSGVEGEYLLARGRAGPGEGEFAPDRTGAEPLPNRSGLAARADLAAGWGSRFGARTRVRTGNDSTAVQQLVLSARAGAFTLSGGRDLVGYGSGLGGGVVLAGGMPLDGLQLETWRPLVGPGWLRYLGPLTFDAFVGHIPGERHPGDPYVWGARGSFQPHPRMTFSIQRAALFGGAGSERPVNFSNILHMLIGRVVGASFEDQVVSMGGRFRLPTESTLPLMVYAEVGSEDAAGSFWQVPGMLAGVESAALPGAPWLSLGVEGSVFAHSCCGNPPWYRHFAFPGSWALDDRPLGHRLGGQGTELAAYGHADLLDARLRVSAEAFRRGRSGENLYLPGREGGSLGGGWDLAWRFDPRAELGAEAHLEDGRGWHEGTLRLSARWIF